MNEIVTILFLVTLWTGTVHATATHPPLQNLHSQRNPEGARPIHGSRDQSWIVFDDTASGSSSDSGPPLEEESEDDDNSKENAFGRITSFYLSKILQQLYLRQNALFRDCHLETAVPPPRM